MKYEIKKENNGYLYGIMSRDGAFVTDEMDMKRVCREHFEFLHNMVNDEKVIVNVCLFDDIRRNRYFEDHVIGRMRRLKSTGMDETTSEMIKNKGEIVIYWIWKLFNKAFVEIMVS